MTDLKTDHIWTDKKDTHRASYGVSFVSILEKIVL